MPLVDLKGQRNHFCFAGISNVMFVNCMGTVFYVNIFYKRYYGEYFYCISSLYAVTVVPKQLVTLYKVRTVLAFSFQLAFSHLSFFLARSFSNKHLPNVLQSLAELNTMEEFESSESVEEMCGPCCHPCGKDKQGISGKNGYGGVWAKTRNFKAYVADLDINKFGTNCT